MRARNREKTTCIALSGRASRDGVANQSGKTGIFGWTHGFETVGRDP